MTKIPSFAEIELGQPTAATDPAAWAVAFAAAVDDEEIADLIEGDQRVVPGAGAVVDAFTIGGEEAAWRVFG